MRPPLPPPHRCLILLLVCLAGGLAGQSVPADLKAPSDLGQLRGMVNSPKSIVAKVDPVMRDGKIWCDSKADYQVVFRLALGPLARVLMNHESYPVIFPRIDSNVVRRNGAVIEQDQSLTISVLGVRYHSEYTLRGTDTLFSDPPRLLNVWEQTASDGSVTDITGLWYLEEICLDGQTCTYIRYRTRSLVPETFPGQTTIMGWALGNDIIDTIMCVYRAAARS